MLCRVESWLAATQSLPPLHKNFFRRYFARFHRKKALLQMSHDSNEPDWLELAKIAQQSFFNRRELEWKLSLGFWAAIGAFTWLFFSVSDIQVPDHFTCILGVAYVVLFSLTIPFWHLPLQKANGGDKKYYFSYLNRARGIEDSGFIEGKGTWKDVDHTWFIGHLVFSFFFLAVSWFVITQVAVPTAIAASEKDDATFSEAAKQDDPPASRSVPD